MKEKVWEIIVNNIETFELEGTLHEVLDYFYWNRNFVVKKFDEEHQIIWVLGY